jgi:hypothetical protein
MTDPERLLSVDPSPLTQSMLIAAREDTPDQALLERTLLTAGMGAAAVAAGSGLAAGASAGAGTAVGAKAASASLTLITVKWLGLGALTGLLTIGAATGVEHVLGTRAERPVTTLAPAVEVRKPVQKLVAPSTKQAGFAPAKSDVSRHAPPRFAPEVRHDPDEQASLAAALRQIDAARAALATGQFDKVLGIVDAYEASSTSHELEPEALYLKMEALSRSGNPAARQVARKLLADSPDGPYAEPARQIAGQPE